MGYNSHPTTPILSLSLCIHLRFPHLSIHRLTHSGRSSNNRPQSDRSHTRRGRQVRRIRRDIQIEHSLTAAILGQVTLALEGTRLGPNQLGRGGGHRGRSPALPGILERDPAVGGGGQFGVGEGDAFLDLHGVVGQELGGQGAAVGRLGVAAFHDVAACDGRGGSGQGGGG